jgi:hypothetical protein
MNFNQIRRLFIFVILSFCFVGFASAQSWIKKLRSPVFYEIGIQTAWQSNAFNASVGEVEYTATAPEYLGGVTTVSSPELVGLAKIRYEPRLWRGYKSKVRASIFVHHFTEFSIKDFRSMSFNFEQNIGNYQSILLSFRNLPEFYLRNYLSKNATTGIASREKCLFMEQTYTIGYAHRPFKKHRFSYELERQNVVYNAAFSQYDIGIYSMNLDWDWSKFKTLPISASLQYGKAFNLNEIDIVDRSYDNVNGRIKASLRLDLGGLESVSGKLGLDTRQYFSGDENDEIHAGRSHQEYRLEWDVNFAWDSSIKAKIYGGSRYRNVEAINVNIEDFKSFERWWLGLRLSYDFVWNVY